MDGGAIQFKSYDDGIVNLMLQRILLRLPFFNDHA